MIVNNSYHCLLSSEQSLDEGRAGLVEEVKKVGTKCISIFFQETVSL